MKKFIGLFLTMIGLTSFAQYELTESSFSKTYSQLRTWEKPESTWVYSNGSTTQWTFHFNVDFFPFEKSSGMFGAVLVNEEGNPEFFCNYLGELKKGEDEYGIYGSNQVDILYNDPETGRWEYWNTGELRHYGPWTYLFLGDPSKLYFSYFKEKE